MSVTGIALVLFLSLIHIFTFMDEIVIGIGINENKNTYFPIDKREEMIRELYKLSLIHIFKHVRTVSTQKNKWRKPKSALTTRRYQQS